MCVSPLLIKNIEEIGTQEDMGGSNFFERLNLTKLDIWAFHGFFDIWVDLKVMLYGRKGTR